MQMPLDSLGPVTQEISQVELDDTVIVAVPL
jgi:hypothetical protein